ncbi:MAG: Stf0 family sulfotransferase [Acidobacteriota bacterium]
MQDHLARPYDLALAGSDFTRWDGPPHRSIVICSHPRSGSTLLGEAIHFAGGLGCPLEYLHRGFRPAIAERWGTSDVDSYVAALHRHRTGPNGVLSIKLFWQDLEAVAHERAPGRFPLPASRLPEETGPHEYRDLRALLDDILPNAAFVYLERQDRVRQAVSAIVATQTGQWRSVPGMGRQTPVGEPEYDYDRILGMIGFADYSHAHWRGFFAANGIEPYCLTYEELASEFERVVGALFARLGSASVPAPRRMQRQSNDRTEGMVLRFLREHAARTA